MSIIPEVYTVTLPGVIYPLITISLNNPMAQNAQDWIIECGYIDKKDFLTETAGMVRRMGKPYFSTKFVFTNKEIYLAFRLRFE